MDIQAVPLLKETHRELAARALSEWFPEAQLQLERLTTAGSSGVEILVVDLSGDTGPDVPPGKYVLRVGPAVDDLAYDNERAVYQRVMDAAPEFAAAHIPKLITFSVAGQGRDRLIARLLDLAGNSLLRYGVPEVESAGLLRVAEALSGELLDAWAFPNKVGAIPLREVMIKTVGEARTQACLDVVGALFNEGDNIYYENGHAFVNPTLILTARADISVTMMSGMCHGDLNTGNLHVPKEAFPDSGYWIMDIDQARSGFVGFDHAYLELSVLVKAAAKMNPTVLARCLEVVENRHSPHTPPPGTHWLTQFLTDMRAGTRDWVSRQPGREDDLRCQFMLMRMIAALTWARRFAMKDPPIARLCVAYAGWYADRFQRDFPTLCERLPSVVPGPDLEEREESTDALWESFWSEVNGFNAHNTRYILVTEQLPRVDDMAAIGQVPWSMVVDLDPESDDDGLYAMAGPVLASWRALHTISGDRPTVDFARGTGWLLAAGSVVRREPALPFREWVYERLDKVRQLSLAFRGAVGDVPVVIVVLPGRSEKGVGSSRDRLLRVLDTLDEVLRGRAKFVYLGLARVEPSVPMIKISMATTDFLWQLASTVGRQASTVEYRLPGTDGGTVQLSPETMHVLQEHLEIVYDDIESLSVGGETRRNDDFWRGGLLTWADLDAERDVVRSVNEPLRAQLENSLGQHRTRTIVLQHHAGAGGTTAALRAAWDLHHRYPVAVLRMGVPIEAPGVALLADRLHRLFVLTEMPVLFVAEDGDLNEAHREALYRELAARNSRVTILYVRRIVGAPAEGVLAVSEPLDPDETRRFQRQYTRLTTDRARVDELVLLAGRAYERYRTPFFYGLITFEREFTKLSTYVRSHLEPLRGRAQDVMEFAAMATIYSNTGLQFSLVQRLLRLATDARLELEDLVGPKAARLMTVRADRIRLLHQLLAEEVLAELLADGTSAWDLQLGELAMNFIESICHATDPTTDPIRLLFRQVFLDRQSGPQEDADDRGNFAPLIETLDAIDAGLGHKVLKTLTEFVPEEAHFWNHLGRHQMYRLGRDLNRAEEYLQRAIDLKPNEHVHHHTLGLIRRTRMRQALKAAQKLGVPQVMAAVDEWFYRSAECFVTARELNPEDIYGYITHVQTIIDVAQALKRAARVTSVANLTSDAGDWIAEHLTVANELLEVAAQLYNTLERRDDYLDRCLAAIRTLYGDLDAVIELWEVAASGPMNSPMSRRSLAQAYFVRGNRAWRALAREELERVVELADQNLTRHGAKEEDYRLWFEAYKLLPDFDIDEAIGRLQQWSAAFPSWRAQYYRFCLGFYLWFTGRSDDVDMFRDAQQQCLKHIVGRTKRSFLWLAIDPATCPLIAENDLGEWDRRKNFWQETDLLQRVNGVIDYMSGPQAGRIQIDRGVDAFFVPAAGGFLPDSDEGAQVNFFLGFSPEGLRAWGVRRGSSAKALWARKDQVRPRARLYTRPQQEATPAATIRQALEIRRQRVLKFCTDLLTARTPLGVETRMSQLESRVNATFRLPADPGGLRQLLEELPDVRFSEDDDPVIRLGDADPSEVHAELEARRYGRITFVQPEHGHALVELAGGGRVRISLDDITNRSPSSPVRGQVAILSVSQTSRGPRAHDIELLPTTTSLFEDEVVAAADLPRRLESALRAEIETRLMRGEKDFTVADLQGWAEMVFQGSGPIAQRMGRRWFGQYLTQLSWLSFDGPPRNDSRVRLRKRTVFGRLKSQPDRESHNDPPLKLSTVLTEIVRELQAEGNETSLQVIGQRMNSKLGADTYNKLLAGRGLRSALSDLPGWHLEEVKKDLVLVRSDSEMINALLSDVVNELEAEEKPTSLQNVGHMLCARLGVDEYKNLLKGLKLSDFLSSLPDWCVKKHSDDPSTLLLCRLEG